LCANAPDADQAYHNVCQHRGRRLVEPPAGGHNARGKTKQFVCGFHGWRWDINRDNTHILDKDDWKVCLTTENTRLAACASRHLGGWCSSTWTRIASRLRDFLEPAADMSTRSRWRKMRYRWRRWTGVSTAIGRPGSKPFWRAITGLFDPPAVHAVADWYSPSWPQGRTSTPAIARAKKGGDRIPHAHGQGRSA